MKKKFLCVSVLVGLLAAVPSVSMAKNCASAQTMYTTCMEMQQSMGNAGSQQCALSRSALSHCETSS